MKLPSVFPGRKIIKWKKDGWTKYTKKTEMIQALVNASEMWEDPEKGLKAIDRELTRTKFAWKVKDLYNRSKEKFFRQTSS